MTELKTLRVCLSKDLAKDGKEAQRDPSVLYFLYDKLVIYTGMTLYSGDFNIVETMPENPVVGVLYICLDDGYSKIYDEYKVKNIAKTESISQLNILRKAGTAYFVNANKRYLDAQDRKVILPYNNGTYELTVSLAKELKIDRNTIIKFNEKTNEFEIHGGKDIEVPDTTGFYGSETDSVKVMVDKNRIRADIKVSDSPDNILTILNDGLFANTRTKITKQEFLNFMSQYDDYKASISAYMNALSKDIQITMDNISDESIAAKILVALEDQYPTIEEAVKVYKQLVVDIENIETDSKTYAKEQISRMMNIIRDEFEKATSTVWEDALEPDPEPEDEEVEEPEFPDIIEEEIPEDVTDSDENI